MCVRMLMGMLLLPLFLVSQNITVIGIGRLGLCMALAFEQAGHHVLGVDVSPEYVQQINTKTFVSWEPHVTEYLQASRHLKATTSLQDGLNFADLVFIAVQTNDSGDGYDFTLLSQLFTEINRLQAKDKHIVISSTVIPGYIRDVARPLLKDCAGTTVSYNPEFIAQGAIIQGLHYPDIVLIGEGSPQAGDLLESVYRTICFNTPVIGKMTPDSAEITKLALNCFVTMKIAFANLVGDIADQTPNANKNEILQLIGSDQRIGTKCFKAGYGFGGPCFPRDNRTFIAYANQIGIDPVMFKATDLANDMHAERQAQQLLALDLDEYLFEDVCYKSACPVPIITASQKLVIAEKLARANKRVIISDRPEVLTNVFKEYGDLFQYKQIGSGV